MSIPLVSVVMPVFEAAPWVGEAVDSVLSQSFDDFELLVFDDGSTDGSADIVQQRAERDARVVLNRGEHRGYASYLNEGLRRARGEFLARMDADDICLRERFSKQVAFLRQNPECVVVGCQDLVIDSEGAPLGLSAYPCEHETIMSFLLAGVSIISHPGSMMRRDAVLATGGYQERYETIEDFDLWLRLSIRGRLANLPDRLLLYRQTATSVTWTQRDRQIALRDRILAEARATRGLPPLTALRDATLPRNEVGRHLLWATWAASDGFTRSVWKHLRLALRERPRSSATVLAAAQVVTAMAVRPIRIGLQSTSRPVRAVARRLIRAMW